MLDINIRAGHKRLANPFKSDRLLASVAGCVSVVSHTV